MKTEQQWGPIECSVHAENLTKPEQVRIAVSRTIESLLRMEAWPNPGKIAWFSSSWSPPVIDGGTLRIGDRTHREDSMPAQKTDFDVALSFAGEDRDYVDKVAHLLRAKGVNVFYDNFEETELWGRDLYVYLTDVYRKRARFTVMLISQSYVKKLCANHERRAAQARAFEESREYTLPAKFDDTEVGVLPNHGIDQPDSPHAEGNRRACREEACALGRERAKRTGSERLCNRNLGACGRSR